MQSKIMNVVIGIIMTLLLISMSVIVVVNCKQIYYRDIDALGISEYSGLPKEDIIANYDALIEYNSPFYTGSLEFPTLPSSQDGLDHFVEVKRIFMMFYYIALITLFMTIGIVFYKRKKRDYSYLLISSATSILLPTILGIAAFVNFDQTFVLFHKIFFRNDKWLFDEQYDPIITLLPQEFFLHCALFIIGLVILGSILLLVSGILLKRHYNRT